MFPMKLNKMFSMHDMFMQVFIQHENDVLKSPESITMNRNRNKNRIMKIRLSLAKNKNNNNNNKMHEMCMQVFMQFEYDVLKTH